MRTIIFSVLMLLSTWLIGQEKYVLVIHGGAGSISKENISPAEAIAYKAKLEEALKAGYAEIQQGKTSLEAVTAAIMVMENSPLFNAGKGAVFTHDGRNELDASIMYGKTENAGAVAGVTNVKNPILAARAVMDHSPHVMLSRKGAEKFAFEQGLEIVSPVYFWTEDRFKSLQNILEKEEKKDLSAIDKEYPDWKFGTVGAVALDKEGNIAAGTSTGGMTNKKWARIGDSPIIGAGTYANKEVGVSSTGWGEFYIRSVAAYDVAARMMYANQSVDESVAAVLAHIAELGGNGGMIALDKNGNVAMDFNTSGMFRGTVTHDGKIEVKLYAK
ncbi:isoaspartyl peptidase/L-asparaginase [Weeksellaceae bacterium KMM 9724]|uniref:isoaspartyl peptidase/L-asparaginase family protein n=1 Tax=Profundicola chukchiensis TaxID=2961959 RepID=UPI00243C6743|nr:isoaspartyl peptidase/L-asparaginase [Profundicola chukchiensis]MDG4950951.1 isoaspartyl peptidase/L-asparaginase [Profundicola chukchiensis]